jgi:hypothetical protein
MGSIVSTRLYEQALAANRRIGSKTGKAIDLNSINAQLGAIVLRSRSDYSQRVSPASCFVDQCWAGSIYRHHGVDALALTFTLGST